MDTRLSALSSALERDLFEEIGLTCDFLSLATPPPDASFREMAGHALYKSIGKKFLPTDHTEQDRLAYEKFCTINVKCAGWELKLNTCLDETLWGTFKQVLYEFLYPMQWPLVSSFDTIFDKGGVGPGAAVGAPGGDLYSKIFDSDLTYTDPLLLAHYQRYSTRYPSWRMAELIRSAARGDARRVEGSRFSFVPKTTSISRCICVEPVLNMWYQLGIGKILTARLKSAFGLDLSTQQDYNRELARRGSVWGDLATVDLESASDSISLKLCREILPKGFLDLLLRCRSQMYEHEGAWHRFEMVSTMGNGFTFPLQTLIFSAMVSAVYKSFDSEAFGRDRCCGVFGDDIILHTWAVPRLYRLLELAGFVVNRQKSFTEGPFRESCGHDYFNGRNVRGIYVRRLDTDQDLNAAINGLLGWSVKTGVYLHSSIAYLKSCLRKFFMIPPYEDPSSGVRVPLECLLTRPLERDTQGIAYICYVYKARSLRIGDLYVECPKGFRRRKYNPYGLHIAFLAGVALSSGLPVREFGKWTTRRRGSSHWDTLGPDLQSLGITWRGFATCVSETISSLTR